MEIAIRDVREMNMNERIDSAETNTDFSHGA